MGLYCNIEDLNTESDVEQKFIYQFLSLDYPMGLGFTSREILTKLDLRRISIGKGHSKKIYYPDYIISLRGIPVLVVEAKKPGENLELAYSEARLYACEINSKFEHDVSVCKKIIVCNGTETWIGFSDSIEPILKLKFDDFNVESELFSKMQEFCSRRILQEDADLPYKKRRGDAFFRTPVSSLGGRRVQNEELEQNAFGRTLVFENSKIFDPETEEERAIIVDNAYIPSARREQHAEPIYKQIRKFDIPSNRNSIHLPTEDPKDLALSISNRIESRNEAYSLMLIIGNVGSGKTTFVRWFKRRYLEPKFSALASKCEWIFMDMNFAPNSKDEIYSWVKGELLHTIEIKHTDIAFRHIDTIKHMFRNDINEFENGVGQFIINDKSEYNRELYKILSAKMSDIETMLNAVLDFLRGDFGLVPIVVLDNCDKRDRDTQLLMFEMAQWLRAHFKCIVILPMRDTTYDMYKDEKPLDTIVKDLVFRIDPPDLLKVLQARLEYISRTISDRRREYSLENNMVVHIGDDELVDYYKSIMVAIRQSDMIRNIFYRLSDRNTRKGIEMFEDFCKSGHITASEIFQIRASEGNCTIPNYKFLNAILRKNRRYYNGDESNFINLFASNYNDDFPDPFIRIDILDLVRKYKEANSYEGANKSIQYFDLVHEMELIGHEKRVTKREIDYLIKKGLLYSEMQLGAAEDNDLIRITIPGMLHLNMLNNVPYLAACSENVCYKNTETTTAISNRLSNDKYLTKLTMVLNAKEMLHYLEWYRNEYFARPEAYIAEGKYENIFDLSICRNAVLNFIEKDSFLKDIIDKMARYNVGEKVHAIVIQKQKGSLVCLVSGVDGLKGFLSEYEEKYNMSHSVYQEVVQGDEIKCEIISFDTFHGSFQLKYIDADV